ncbi:hypothetical protein RRF57_010002 [Xylaria bambusicola]|uniref:Protein kinase domain-containing protein n=1 Tax=Xylaria bambusicola TaxID=326684 RepID=A0AAN7URK8_9PEZI
MSTGINVDVLAQGSQVEASDQGTQPESDVDTPKDEQVESGESEYIEYRPIGVDNIENIDLYNKGGHHPVNLGDVLNGRYEVVHKLGNGGFGLVWLCQDTKTNKWRALKILTAIDSAHSKEEKVYKHLLQTSSPMELENNHLVMPSEQFWIDGPNGRHYCIVLPVLGQNAADWRSYTLKDKIRENNGRVSNQVQIELHRVCADLVQAVRYLHERGVCHGDLKARNVLMRVEGLDKISKTEMLKLLGKPSTFRVETESGKSPAPHAPEYIIVPAYGWWEGITTSSPAITDFGESYLISDPPNFNVMSFGYAPPEVIWEKTFQPGFHSDIWSLAATLYELVCDEAMFDDQDVGCILRDFEFFLGGLPQPYRAVYFEEWRAMSGRPLDTATQKENQTGAIDEVRWEKRTIKSKYESLIEEREAIVKRTGYADHFEAALGAPSCYCPNIHNEELTLDERNERIYIHLPREDVIGVADLLRKMIRYDPAKRITISEVANHPWIKKSSKVPATTYLLAQLNPGRVVKALAILSAAVIVYVSRSRRSQSI